MLSEDPISMLFHAGLVGLALYVVMTYAMGQSADIATTRSIFGGLLAGLYMIMFGHGLPGRINPNLF